VPSLELSDELIGIAISGRHPGVPGLNPFHRSQPRKSRR
jgi:hypothetical protein